MTATTDALTKAWRAEAATSVELAFARAELNHIHTLLDSAGVESNESAAMRVAGLVVILDESEFWKDYYKEKK